MTNGFMFVPVQVYRANSLVACDIQPSVVGIFTCPYIMVAFLHRVALRARLSDDRRISIMRLIYDP